jgi:hypothetical protein
MSKIFFDPRNQISMPNNPHYHSSKVSLVSPLARNNFQSWTFQGKSFRLFAVALRLFTPQDGVFSVALYKRRATAVKVKRRHLVAEMLTLQTDKPTKPSCPIDIPSFSDGNASFVSRMIILI